MALVPEDKERHVIPNWRGFILTASQRELSAFTTEKQRSVDIARYIHDWNLNRDIYYAGDLIGAVIANNIPINEDIIAAAEFVFHNRKTCSELLLTAAKYILGHNTDVQLSAKYTNSKMVLDSIIQKPELYKSIADLKRTISIYPYNPISYVEISRFYAILGQNGQAEKHMRIALSLANDNRYVMRSAVRLFTHINKQEEALFILRHCQALKYDPWLLSADISLSSLLNRHQKYVKIGQLMIKDQNYSRNSISELSSAIATLEFANGALKNSRNLFDISLYDPTDNSLAQAEWARSRSLNINAEDKIKTVSNNYEANTISSVNQDKYNDALFYASLWINDMQYATIPILYASHIAISLIHDLDISEQILLVGLSSNPSDPTILNNLAYVYALSNKISQAEQCIARANAYRDIPESTKSCLLATQGLLEFRKGNIDLGRKLYSEVINQTSNNISHPELNWSAIINYAREEIRIHSELASSAINAVEKIKERSIDKDITIMKTRLLRSIE